MVKNLRLKERKVYDCEIVTTAGRTAYEGRAIYLGRVLGVNGGLHGLLYRDGNCIELMKSSQLCIELMKSSQLFRDGSKLVMRASVRDYSNLFGDELKGCDLMLKEAEL